VFLVGDGLPGQQPVLSAGSGPEMQGLKTR
jgi:hypothetical protein